MHKLLSTSEHGPLDAKAVEDLAGNFLDGYVRGIQTRNARLSHQAIGLLQFPTTLLEGGITTAGATLLANLRKPDRVDGQTVESILP